MPDQEERGHRPGSIRRAASTSVGLASDRDRGRQPDLERRAHDPTRSPRSRCRRGSPRHAERWRVRDRCRRSRASEPGPPDRSARTRGRAPSRGSRSRCRTHERRPIRCPPTPMRPRRRPPSCSGRRCPTGCGPTMRGLAPNHGPPEPGATRTSIVSPASIAALSNRDASSRTNLSRWTRSSSSLPDSSRDRSSRSATMRESRTASASSCAANRGTAAGSSCHTFKSVSAAAWIDAAGVFNS